MSATSTNPVHAHRPRQGWWQFSLWSLLVFVVAACVVATHLGERRRRELAERAFRQLELENQSLRRELGVQDKPASFLAVADARQVYVQALPPMATSPEGLGWRWRIYLPPRRKWWLHISQGERWDKDKQWYDHGNGVASQDIQVSGEVTISACVSHDLGGGRYIQVWSPKESFALRLDDAGLAAIKAAGQVATDVAGAINQESFSPQKPVQLLRWHRQVEAGTDASTSRDSQGLKLPTEYGFAIHLIDESPNRRTPAPR